MKLDNKEIFPEIRLSWNWDELMLEELHMKGKRKLRRLTYYKAPWLGMGGGDDLLVPNLLRLMKYNKGTSYEDFKKQFIAIVEKTADELSKGELKGYNPKNMFGISEMEVFYLEVEPVGTEPFVLELKDASVNVSWTKFSSYSPGSDFNLSDPYYTQIESSSSAVARKFYKFVESAEDIKWEDMTWADFLILLKKEGMGYKTNHSVWH